MITITSDGVDLTLLIDPKASKEKIKETGGMLMYELKELDNYNFRPSGYTVSDFYDECIFKTRERLYNNEYVKWVKNPIQIINSINDTINFGCRKGRPFKFVEPYLIKKYYRFGLVQAGSVEVIDFIYKSLIFKPTSSGKISGRGKVCNNLDFWGYSGI